METFLFDLVSRLDSNWKEVDLLLEEAKRIQDSNTDLCHALCRSSSILIVAHLEGFSKNLIKSIIADLNKYCDFRDLPRPIQRTYCRKYLGQNSEKNSKSYENRVNELVNKFSTIGGSISEEPFLFTHNKNPHSDTLVSLFQNWGIRNIFAHLHQSDLDIVFSDSHQRTRECIEDQKRHILEAVKIFPYECELSRIKLEKVSISKSEKTLWQDFLEQINMTRNGIAHGNNFENIESVISIQAAKDKVVYLQLGLVEILASHCWTEHKS